MGSRLCDLQILFFEFRTYLLWFPDVVAAFVVYLLIHDGSLFNWSVPCGSRNQVRSRSSFMDWWQGRNLDDLRFQGRWLKGSNHYFSNRLKGSTWIPSKQSLFYIIFLMRGEETQNRRTIRKGSDCRVLHDLHFNKTHSIYIYKNKIKPWRRATVETKPTAH